LLGQGGPAGTERLESSIRAYFRFFQENPSFTKLLVRGHLEDSDKEEPMSAQLLSTGARVIAQGQREGRIRDDVEPEFVLIGFLSLVAYWFQCRDRYLPDMGLCRDPSSYDEQYLEFILKVYIAGIEPRETKPAAH
jgi:hypothetical protein